MTGRFGNSPLKGVSYLGRFISPHQMTDPLEWRKDQVRLFHRDIRLKKALSGTVGTRWN
jgi:hypothetical protein